jgi:ankyrin repeat protein
MQILAKVEQLLHTGNDAATVNSGAALTLAAYLDHTKIVKLLIDAGSYVDAWDQLPATSLIYSAYLGNVEIVQALLDAGAGVDFDVKSPLGTPLFAAVSGRNTEVVKLLLDGGAKVKTRERHHKTGVDAADLMKTAEENGDTEIVGLLKKTLQKELINELGDASYMGDIEVVKILIGMGADVNAEDSSGNTAVKNASMAGNKIVYEYLIANGAVPDMFISASAADVQRIKEFINNGADVNSVNKYGSTALMLASSDSAVEVMELLLLNGALINHQNKQGITALTKATREGWKEAVKVLLDSGADIHIRDKDNKNALYYAEEYSAVDRVVSREIMEMLKNSETVIEASANDSGIRIRNNPTTSNSRVVGSVNKGDKVIIFGKSEKEEKIQNMTAYWYKIQTEDNIVGYAYGYFFDVRTVAIKDIPVF